MKVRLNACECVPNFSPDVCTLPFLEKCVSEWERESGGEEERREGEELG